MPEGTRHDLTGTLVATPSTLLLKLQDGREWRLIAPVGIDRFIDRRVRVSGIRGEGGILHVEAFTQVGR